jgi:hypothetical protein
VYLREKIRAELYRELKTEAMQQFFIRQRYKNPLIKPFTSPGALIEYLHDRENPNLKQKNAILGSLIAAHQKDKNPIWKPLLSIIFWPAIEWVFFRQRNPYTDNDDLFLEVYWAFCEVLWTYPVKKRPHKVASNLKFEVLNLICQQQKKNWQHQYISQLAQQTSRLLKDKILALSTPDITAWDKPKEEELTKEDYRKLLSSGAITETDYLLLVGTKVYGRSLKELAREHNLSYEAAKKRRQRAERAARGLKKNGP